MSGIAKRMVGAAAAMVIATLAACDGDLPEVVTACNYTEDCMPTTVCNIPTSTCVPTPVNGVIGHFDCTIRDSNSGPSDVGDTDLTGTLGGASANLLQSADCALDSSGAQPFITLIVTAEEYMDQPRLRLILRLPVAAQPEGGFAIKSVSSSADILGAYMNQYTESDPLSNVTALNQNLAYATSGTVVLETPIDMAAVDMDLAGYIEVHFALAKSPPTLACPNGPSDCGPDPNAVCDSSSGTALCAVGCPLGPDTCPNSATCVNGLCQP